MRFLLIPLLAFAFALSSHAADDGSRLDLVLFDGGTPVPGVRLLIDDEPLGATDRNGALSVPVPAGASRLTLVRDGAVIGTLALEVTAGRPVQVIAALPDTPDGAMDFDVEGAGIGAASATVAADVVTGRLAGRVVSSEDGSPVAGAQVFFSGADVRAATDSEGVFAATLPAGEYRISIVHPDFSTQTEEGVAVVGDAEVTLALELSPAGLMLADYTVSAPHIEGSVASVFARQRESSGVSEVLGAEQMSRSGDSSAADALKRVTGLTIEDGKYVVVRGQPARYTLTLWNGSRLPSPDPVRMIVPLDLFPTGVLASINVEKSYDAEAPGSFGGGLILLETAGVPEEGFLELSAKVGGNSLTTGQDGYDYEGGGRDILGFDDGTRDLPPGLAPGNTVAQTTAAAQGFTNIWDIDTVSVEPDTGLGLSGGKRFRALGGTLGLRAGVNWSRSFSTTETIERDYAVRGDGTLAIRNDQLQTRTDMDVDLGGLLVAAAEWEKHELRSNTFLIRKSTKRSEITEGTRVVSQDLFIRDYLLEWNERELFAQQLIGGHDFDWLRIDWRAMVANSERSSPDRRDYIYRRQTNGDFVFFNQNRAGRRFDDSEDDIASLDVDLLLPVVDRGRWKLDLQAGASTYSQDRESLTRRFSIEALPGADIGEPPEILLDPAGLGTSLVARDQTQTNDNYLGEARVDGIYMKFDSDWSETVRLAAGARRERADYEVRTFVAGGSQGGQEVGAGFRKSDLLPFLALTWRFREDMQFRFSGSRTISRPVLNELSPARYYDPESGEEYLGNPNLEPATIDSLDLRWEWYPSGREAVSLGVFVKDYTDPIEQSFVGVGGSAFLNQVQNAAGASVFGIEASGRTDLARVIAPLGLDGNWIDRTYVQANAAIIDSEVELARQDLATSRVRPLQGQAEFVFNLQLGYDGERHDANLSFNVVGERLHLAGVQGLPDVYQQPVLQLDFNYSIELADDLRLKLNADNLLDTEYEYTQGGEIYRSYTKGIDLGASLNWRF